MTDAAVLENLSNQGHEVATLLLRWRSLAKLQSTYVDGLIEAINPKTGRIHTNFSMVGATTGRLSSSDPNLQNIPIKTADGRLIRQAFVVKPGSVLVSLDYAQIELRLLAHFADVPTLQEAFAQERDIHLATACELYGVELSQVTETMRRHAKTINFGIIYGISAFGLGQQLGISTSQAAQVIKDYFARYPGIEAYVADQTKKAHHLGYVETLFGRRCHISGIGDKSAAVRHFSERQAANAPLQGSNADIIKKAMVEIYELLKSRGQEEYMILQVHDELLFEIPRDQVDVLVPLLKTIMENVVTLKVPLVVGVGQGDNWAQAHYGSVKNSENE